MIPVHHGGWFDHVVAGQGRNRNAGNVGDVELSRKVTIDPYDPFVDGMGPRHEVHLVDRQEHVTDAEEGEDRGVTAGLRHHALAGVDEDNCEIGGRRAGRHVARVLLVTRCVGDDEGTFVGRERAIGHVDRDALLAFRLEAVDQQRQVERAAQGAVPLAVGLDPGKLVLEDEFGFVEQAADQGGLAVVHAAAGDEAQDVPFLPGIDIGAELLRRRGRAHQK